MTAGAAPGTAATATAAGIPRSCARATAGVAVDGGEMLGHHVPRRAVPVTAHPRREEIDVGATGEVDRDPATVTRLQQAARPARRDGARGRDAEDLGALVQQRHAVDAELGAETRCGTLDRSRGVPPSHVPPSQWKTSPPFTSSAWPVITDERSDAKKTTAFAVSSSVGISPSGIAAATSSYDSFGLFPVCDSIMAK